MTDDLITLFIELKGQELYDQIYEYLIDNGIYDEFQEIYPDKDKLFAFSIKYGIYDIMTFLYEDFNLEYDLKVLSEYDNQLKKDEMDPSKVLVEGGGSKNQGLKLHFDDKFSKNRNICIAYLMESRKWSQMKYKNGGFYYKCKNNKRRKFN